MRVCLNYEQGNIIHLMSDPEGNSYYCFPESPDVSRDEVELTGFPKGPDIECFIIFLYFHYNSNKRITGANQNSRLGTYNNTNSILKTTE